METKKRHARERPLTRERARRLDPKSLRGKDSIRGMWIERPFMTREAFPEEECAAIKNMKKIAIYHHLCALLCLNYNKGIS